MTRYVLCLTTIGSVRDGEKIARHLVQKKLAACVNVVSGAISFYFWKKKFCRDREALLFIKTIRSKLPRVESELHTVHPYELPEFIVLPISSGSHRYLKWLASAIKA